VNPYFTDAQFQTLGLVVVAAITIVPATLAAIWSRQSKTNSKITADEVKSNGGMSDPVPNVNDHIKYQTEMLESIVFRLDNQDQILGDHLAKSNLMDQALAEVYLAWKKGDFTLRRTEEDD
jgi:hypothetical protein